MNLIDKYNFKFYNSIFVVLGIKAKASFIPGKHSTTEVHPHNIFTLLVQ
jgi:hypothetical protein